MARYIAQYFSRAGLIMLFGGVATGTLAVLAFPNFSYWYVAWIAFVPLLTSLALTALIPTSSGDATALDREAQITPDLKSQGFMAGLLAGSLFFYGTCYWLSYSMIHYGGIAASVAYLLVLIPVIVSALFWGGFATLVVATVRQHGKLALLFAPIFWTASEYLRAIITDVGWNMWGYSQAFQPPLLWPAAYGGVWLVGTLLMTTSAAIAYFIVSQRTRTLNASAVAILIVGLLLPVAIFKLAPSENNLPSLITANAGTDPTPTPPLAAAGIIYAIQGNAPVDASEMQLSQSFRQQLQATLTALKTPNFTNLNMTAEAATVLTANRPVIVIWPEAPYHLAYDRDPELAQILGNFARQQQIYWLLNAETGPDARQTYNSLIALSPQGQLIGQYQKVHLLPFGEYIPARQWLPFADQITAVAGDFAAANDYQLLAVGPLQIGSAICFEAAFPAASRRLTQRGAQLLVNVANDGWFGRTPIGRQHLAHNILRAVENHRPLIRVANSGITAYITPMGQVRDATTLFETTVRGWSLPPLDGTTTFYTRYGDLVAQSCVILSLIAWVATRWQRKLLPAKVSTNTN